MDRHLKTKMHQDNVTRKDTDITGDDNNNIAREGNGETWSETHNKTERYCNISNTRYKKMNTMNQMNIKKMIKRKNLLIRSGEIKLMSWD